jgi:hypothetical protein
MERKDKDTIYINIIDEADGVFASDSDGKISAEDRKLVSDVKANFGDGKGDGHIFTVMISNYTDEKSMEPALTQRFEPLKFEGPATPEQYGQCLRVHLRKYESAGKVDSGVDWDYLGRMMNSYKTQCNLTVTGRSCKIVCNGLGKLKASKRDRLKLANMPYAQQNSQRNRLRPVITQEVIEKRIEEYFDILVDSKDFRIGSRRISSLPRVGNDPAFESDDYRVSVVR